MKPVAVVALVVSTALLAFFFGRLSVSSSGSCHMAATPIDPSARPAIRAMPAMPGPPAMPEPPAMPAMPVHPAMPGSAPPVAAHDESSAPLSGRVVEIIQVPGYTYLRLDGDRWAAIPATTKLSVGSKVTLVDTMVMNGFASPTLKRTFDTIYFAQLAP